MNEIKLPPFKETEFLKTSAIRPTELPVGEIHYLDMVGFDHEKKLEPGEYQEVSLRKFSKAFQLENFQVQAEIDPIALKQIEDLHGISMRDQMISALLNEDLIGREKLLHKKYAELAEKSRDIFLTTWQKIVRKIFKELKFPKHVLTSNDLVRNILLHCNMIAERSRRGPGNFVVASAEIVSLLEDSPAFTYKQIEGPLRLGISIFEEIGNLKGVRVFRNSLVKFNDRTVIVGRITKEKEAGVYFVMKDSEFMEMADTMTLKTKLCIKSRMAVVETVNADKNFLVFDVEIAKKPWWRKLFKL